MRTKKFIVIGFAVAIVVLLVIIAASKHQTTAVANPCPQFLADIQNGHADKAYAYLSPSLQSDKTKSQFVSSMTSIQKAFSTVKPLARPGNTVIPTKKGAT